MIRLVLAGFIGLTLVSAAVPQDVTERERAACLPDVRRLCPAGTEDDIQRALACLAAHADRVGRHCRAVVIIRIRAGH